MKQHWHWIPIGLLLAGITALMWSVHVDDARLDAECRQRGGVFVHARDPVHVCVMPARQ